MNQGDVRCGHTGLIKPHHDLKPKKSPPLLGELLLGIMWGLTLGIIGVAGLGHLLRATGGIVGPIRHLNFTVGGYSSVFFCSAPNYECGERCHSECNGKIFGVFL